MLLTLLPALLRGDGALDSDWSATWTLKAEKNACHRPPKGSMREL
jgi:hypothetical protein